MSVRQWLYETIKDYPALFAFHNGRVLQGESLTTAQVQKPYLVYRLGNDTDENLGGEGATDPQPHRTFFQVYVHDTPGDYDQIDAIITELKNAFRAAGGSPANGILAVRYLEVSRDLDDQTLGTILRYVRFQFVLTK